MWVAIIIGLHLGFGVTERSNKELYASIEKTLLQNCDCESVVSIGKTSAIQYRKNSGLATSDLEFTLKFCHLNTSLEEEAERLNNVLKRNVAEYNTKRLITFNFESEDQVKSIDIKINN